MVSVGTERFMLLQSPTNAHPRNKSFASGPVCSLEIPPMLNRLKAILNSRAWDQLAHRDSAGVTTFLTMAYIVLVNPAILSAAGMPLAAVTAATCLSRLSAPS